MNRSGVRKNIYKLCVFIITEVKARPEVVSVHITTPKPIEVGESSLYRPVGLKIVSLTMVSNSE